MTRVSVRLLPSAAAIAAALVIQGSSTLHAQSLTGSERGAAALGSTLAGVGTTGRVLTIAAHPDDEDTQFIAWLARGRHVETAYLSLTRGDGGQNLIGNYLGEALGTIRTQELMAARRIDGGRQYFTRAYDFGFSKNAEETYEHWPKDSILGDVVRVVRAFRPHVIVAFFSGTPRDGHGHHQVSGILAREAYDLAADTVRFPARQYGAPWTPQKFYRSARQNMDSATLRMNVGEYDPLLGRSYYEIAAESRSQHKSQGFGVLQRKGVIMDAITREATRASAPQDARAERTLFDGVDTTWSRLRARIPSESGKLLLDSAAAAIAQAKSSYRAEDPSPIVEPLARALRATRAARAASSPPPGARTDIELYDALALTAARLESALLLAAGVAVEATAPRAEFPVRVREKRAVNDSLAVAVVVFNRGRAPVTLRSAIVGGFGTRNSATPEINVAVAPDSAYSQQRFATALAPTSPWWQSLGRSGDVFVRGIGAADEAEHQSETAVIARTLLNVAGVDVRVDVAVVNRYADPVKGDQQVPVAAVPGITIALDDAMEYVRAGVPVQRDFPVHVLSAYPDSTPVIVRLQLPPGLTADSLQRPRVLAPNTPMTLTFRTRGNVQAGKLTLGALAKHLGADAFEGYYTIAYDHITPQRLYAPSGMYLSAVDVKLPPRARVGYIPGVGDRGIQALQQLDVQVVRLDTSLVSALDLSQFTSIVVGPRAYESSDALVRLNPKLLAYARAGGTLVVQYGQTMDRLNVTPFPLGWTRPAARVTIEDAPVKVLRPDAPLITTPNRITSTDWADWVQERATYMPSTIAPQYTSYLEMHDPEEPENRGALLSAPLGKGRYVYVTLALFRQLPNGVPGAARILLNLVNGTAGATSITP